LGGDPQTQKPKSYTHMSEPFVGEIRMVGFNFAARGWMLCNGQLLPIAQNAALFSLLGTTYGGNGTTTFALPDLRGRAPVHQGQGPGLSNYVMGQSAGVETVTLISTQMPIHTHLVNASSVIGESTAPTSNILAVVGDPNAGTTFSAYSPPATANTTLSPTALGTAGGNQPHENLQPYLCVNFMIATQGIFPSRN
jgi:microcystin-dependent protein